MLDGLKGDKSQLFNKHAKNNNVEDINWDNIDDINSD